ncbi:MAG TPA: metal-dependent transcriptional regulator [Vicinamibacterales bacterium]|nr:metal-dependent transcriptional regulator [Vicinamibacterales bacterium]
MSGLLAVLLGISLGITLVGLVQWRHARRARHLRDQIEDALKHLSEEEYRGRRASLSSLGGALRMSSANVVALVGRMQRQRLLATEGQGFRLTPEGERLALQVVRAHRLLERYLVDEARLPLREVHAVAERKEHSLSPADADRLSAALGHPTHDPHGDPIPTREGAVEPATGTPATSWPAHTMGRIVHLEDEPEISFAQILATGLHMGQLVQVVESTPECVVLSDGHREYRLAPAVAANVFIGAAPVRTWPDPVVRLSDLMDNAPAEVVGLDEACQGFSRRRLMDLGFTDGARIRPFLKTFAGDPRAYEVRGTLIALRRDQAAHILVRPVADQPSAEPGS